MLVEIDTVEIEGMMTPSKIYVEYCVYVFTVLSVSQIQIS